VFFAWLTTADAINWSANDEQSRAAYLGATKFQQVSDHYPFPTIRSISASLSSAAQYIFNVDRSVYGPHLRSRDVNRTYICVCNIFTLQRSCGKPRWLPHQPPSFIYTPVPSVFSVQRFTPLQNQPFSGSSAAALTWLPAPLVVWPQKGISTTRMIVSALTSRYILC